MILLYTAIYVPFKLAFLDDFNTQNVSKIVDRVVDSLFMFDLLINFLTAYEDSIGGLIHKPNLIAKNYIKGWFFIDLVAW